MQPPPMGLTARIAASSSINAVNFHLPAQRNVSVAAMCVRNPDCSPVGIDRRDVAQNPTALLEIVSDDFPVTSRERWLFCSTHANLTAAAPPVTFQSPCSCRDAHGKARLSVKNDASVPPVNANAIQSLEPRFEITLAFASFYYIPRRSAPYIL